LPTAAAVPRRGSALFNTLKKAFDKGESAWTPASVLALGYAIALPLFLLMLVLAELAYHFA
jgi:hypothetical protein